MVASARPDIRHLRAAQKLLAAISARGTAPHVVEAMAAVPRHEFVPSDLADLAYEDRALPIGLGQTISQPTLVARMTDMLGVHRMSRVLEVGTGCGYQTAILAELASHVYSIELEEELARAAHARLRGLGYHNVTQRTGDGHAGWPDKAPFDAVLVTAAPETEIPPALVEQLSPGGRLVSPLRDDLFLVRRTAVGTEQTFLGKVKFVPLRRREP
jgi:protein-L-isoaspartate(D-aspartate) O-methyltransferase